MTPPADTGFQKVQTPNALFPDGKAPTLALVHPTPAEKLATWKLNGASWRGALSLDAYLRREVHLASQALTKDGGITYWVLVDTAVKDRPILCSCETLRKKALVSRDGIVEEVVSHGIGSVFCPPDMRGRGYASRMMKELGKNLQVWQTEGKKCLFTVLYSDIGKRFYASHGWHPFPSSHITLPTVSAEEDALRRSQPLTAQSLQALCDIDEALLRRNLRRANISEQGKVQIALIPDIETISWHHAREEFVAHELFGRRPDVKGAIVEVEVGRRAWCIWTRVWSAVDNAEDINTLHILRLVVEGEDPIDRNAQSPANSVLEQEVNAVTILLAAAQHEAAQWNMHEVQVWNPTANTVRAAKQLLSTTEVIERDAESITSLMWYGGPSVLSDSSGEVKWVGNEKYGWC
ncbi:MAG: hypothetical protein M1827_002436 [Pycnora praestabilis]|nr:MAG: hypothetical protein M1827_002436 [Pycnora praestabilis]